MQNTDPEKPNHFQTLQYGRHALHTILAVVILSTQAYAQTNSSASLKFQPIDTGTGQTAIVNGESVNAADWRSLLVADLPNGKFCTATFIGPETLITAAHCLDRGIGYTTMMDSIDIKIDGVNIHGKCSVAEEYKTAVANDILKEDPWFPRVNEDYALCTFKMPTPAPPTLTDMRLENLDLSAGPAANTPAIFAGYGCTQYGQKPIEGKEKVLLIGKMAITEAASDGGDYMKKFITISADLKLKQPSLCPGDSGGPLFTLLDKDSAARRMRGIGALYDRAPKTAPTRVDSKFAPLASASFKKLIDTWKTENPGKQICGINSTAGIKPCHD